MNIAQKLITGVLLAGITSLASAEFVVEQKDSHVGFASVKNDVIAENHSFTGISGGVDSGGNAMIAVILSTVETLIPIRNERMRTMLFNVDRYPLATVRSKVDIDGFTALDVGESVVDTINLDISLHGVEVSKPATVKVTRLSKQSYDVSSLGPVMLNAGDFKLLDGLAALQEIAGLQSIDAMVPVTFNLHLTDI